MTRKFLNFLICYGEDIGLGCDGFGGDICGFCAQTLCRSAVSKAGSVYADVELCSEDGRTCREGSYTGI